MIPLPPLSVKFTDDEREAIKALAISLGWTESQVMRESWAFTRHRIEYPNSKEEPNIIVLARLKRLHDENPALLQQHMKRVHHAPSK